MRQCDGVKLAVFRFSETAMSIVAFALIGNVWFLLTFMSLRSFSGFGAATVSDPSSCFRLRNKPLVSVLGADLHDSPWCEDEVLEPLLIVFILAVPCHSHESLFGGKTLYAGKELRKETLPLQSGSRVYRVQGIKSSSWYEVKISFLWKVSSFVVMTDPCSVLAATIEEW
ncbi:hypothetical protein Bca52824_063467 [Brassica carinata]|uniref:Uncharacterized protein n=1 Tax=Brassica carinata TaxID=52824 RepID=A0A8X7QEV2_BRACI|nr:hypothetical protein Bca52824_063467 [Brassica carinata]